MQLTTKEFTECFGGMTPECEQEISKHDFRYKVLKGIDNTYCNLESVGKIDKWNKGWQENYEAFKITHSVSDLRPKYYHLGRPLRYKDNFIQGKDPDFEYNFLKVMRAYIFSYLNDYSPIYEFGCGTSLNLVALAETYPEKTLHGLDWAMPSVKLINEINTSLGLNIKPHLFDMFNPGELDIPGGSAIFTWGVLEQLGDKFEPFLKLLASKKVFVINIEPLAELLDLDNLLDYNSMKYMQKRGYLKGYLTKLWGMKNIEIIETRRIHFGNMNYEGWSFVIWRVK